MPDLHWHTTDPLLQTVLKAVMATSLFDPFRLVGGTALALQIGHRMSEDIDLFTDALYDSLDFDASMHGCDNNTYMSLFLMLDLLDLADFISLVTTIRRLSYSTSVTQIPLSNLLLYGNRYEWLLSKRSLP